MEKVNIIKFLKDCPHGMELNCLILENLYLDKISEDEYSKYPIFCFTIDENGNRNSISFTKDGCVTPRYGSKCVIFPKGKTTWEGFQRPFKDGDIVAYDNPHRDNVEIFIFKDKRENNTLSYYYLMLDGNELELEEGSYYVTRLATEEEKQKLFDVIKANGYKWNPETKTLEKLVEPLVEPKFKPNDIVETNDNLYGCITDDIEYDKDKKSFKYYVSFIVDGGYYYEYQLKPHKSKDKTDMGEVSDGYHTFNELYEYRLLYNASMFNELAKQGLYDVHKSKRHSDGEIPFGNSNWFIVMAELPTGQISNHYEIKDWNLFQITEKEKANKWDGHTPKDVAERIRKFLTPKPKYPTTYEECCEVLGIYSNRNFVCNGLTHKASNYDLKLFSLLEAFKQLIICRDAYWKIAGEETGLGRPWELSDCDSDYITGRYCIFVHEGNIICNTPAQDCILTFPTEEMRDAFYENFKELIKSCKELL